MERTRRARAGAAGAGAQLQGEGWSDARKLAAGLRAAPRTAPTHPPTHPAPPPPAPLSQRAAQGLVHRVVHSARPCLYAPVCGNADVRRLRRRGARISAWRQPPCLPPTASLPPPPSLAAPALCAPACTHHSAAPPLAPPPPLTPSRGRALPLLPLALSLSSALAHCLPLTTRSLATVSGHYNSQSTTGACGASARASRRRVPPAAHSYGTDSLRPANRPFTDVHPPSPVLCCVPSSSARRRSTMRGVRVCNGWAAMDPRHSQLRSQPHCRTTIPPHTARTSCVSHRALHGCLQLHV